MCSPDSQYVASVLTLLANFKLGPSWTTVRASFLECRSNHSWAFVEMQVQLSVVTLVQSSIILVTLLILGMQCPSQPFVGWKCVAWHLTFVDGMQARSIVGMWNVQPSPWNLGDTDLYPNFPLNLMWFRMWEGPLHPNASVFANVVYRLMLPHSVDSPCCILWQHFVALHLGINSLTQIEIPLKCV